MSELSSNKPEFNPQKGGTPLEVADYLYTTCKQARFEKIFARNGKVQILGRIPDDSTESGWKETQLDLIGGDFENTQIEESIRERILNMTAVSQNVRILAEQIDKEKGELVLKEFGPAVEVSQAMSQSGESLLKSIRSLGNQ